MLKFMNWGCCRLYVLAIGTYVTIRCIGTTIWFSYIQPFEKIEYEILGSKTNARTFKCCEMVYKLFDVEEEPYFHPNADFLSKYGGVTARVESLTTDNRVVVLKYPVTIHPGT